MGFYLISHFLVGGGGGGGDLSLPYEGHLDL